MATTKTIKITDVGRERGSFRGGINGRMFDFREGQTFDAEPEIEAYLTDQGVSFEEVSGGAGSKEGSAAPAPEITADAVLKPHMEPRSAESGPTAGDQSGDVTSAGSAATPPASGEKGDNSIAEAARISDIRVAAERRISGDASPAEIAGEGEQGTPKAELGSTKAAKPAARKSRK